MPKFDPKTFFQSKDDAPKGTKKAFRKDGAADKKAPVGAKKGVAPKGKPGGKKYF